MPEQLFFINDLLLVKEWSVHKQVTPKSAFEERGTTCTIIPFPPNPPPTPAWRAQITPGQAAGNQRPLKTTGC